MKPSDDNINSMDSWKLDVATEFQKNCCLNIQVSSLFGKNQRQSPFFSISLKKVSLVIDCSCSFFTRIVWTCFDTYHLLLIARSCLTLCLEHGF